MHHSASYSLLFENCTNAPEFLPVFLTELNVEASMLRVGNSSFGIKVTADVCDTFLRSMKQKRIEMQIKK